MSVPPLNSIADSAASRDALSTAQSLWQLTKPGVTRLVVVTMMCGALVAPLRIDFMRVAIALLGTSMVVAAANALNMYLERDSDAYMQRTRNRPLPAGRLAPEVALWFGIALALIGLCVVTFMVNPISGLLAAVALVSYVLLYTPLKRVTPFALYVGAVPGAIPPVIGWTSVAGELSLQAAVLFAILFAWQLPHFLAISLFRQEEYRRAGLSVFPNTASLISTKWHIIGTALVLLGITLLPPLVGLGGPAYLAIAAVSGLGFVGLAVSGLRPAAGARWARGLFFASMPYLMVVFGALVISAA